MASGSNINQAIEKLENDTAQCIEWASRQGLQFDTTNIEAALLTHRLGHKNHLQPTQTARIRVRDGSIQFNTHAIR